MLQCVTNNLARPDVSQEHGAFILQAVHNRANALCDTSRMTYINSYMFRRLGAIFSDLLQRRRTSRNV